MDTLENNRLRAFLDRNRTRHPTTTSAEKDYFPLITAPDSDNPNSFQYGETQASNPLSSRSHFNQQIPSAQGGLNSNYLGSRSDRPSYYNESQMPNQEGRQFTNATNYDSPQSRKVINTIQTTPGNFTQRENLQSLQSYPDEEMDRGRKNYSSSPAKIRENKQSKNYIEMFLANKKMAESKIMKENIRSVSREPKKLPIHLKTKSSVSTYQSNASRVQSGFESDTQEAQGSLSARRMPQVLKGGFKEPLKRDASGNKHQTIKSPRNMRNKTNNQKIFSTMKKQKEENHEFVFEEMAGLSKGNNKAIRGISKSKELSRPTSLTPRGTKTQEKKPQATPPPQVKERVSNKVPESLENQQRGIFPESSKRLKAMEETTDSESKFKKEIKKLINVIKQEKEQISHDMESMAKELNKYKIAYKKLKKQLQNQNDENRGPSEERRQNRASPRQTSIDKKRKNSVQKEEDMDTPFTIEELTQHFDNHPINKEKDQVELLSKMSHLNSDVETIVAKKTREISALDSKSSQNVETHNFSLRKNAVNCYIIKEMNLASHIFFQQTVKDPEEEPNFKPTVIDLLAAQREIIHFLVRKLEIEDKQRLKTEEQASKMMVQMEKAIKQKDERTPKKNSGSAAELNRSYISQN